MEDPNYLELFAFLIGLLILNRSSQKSDFPEKRR